VALVVGVPVNSLAAVPLASRDHLDLGAGYPRPEARSVRFRTFGVLVSEPFSPLDALALASTHASSITRGMAKRKNMEAQDIAPEV